MKDNKEKEINKYKARKVRNELSKKYYAYMNSSEGFPICTKINIEGFEELENPEVDEFNPTIINGVQLAHEKFQVLEMILDDENILVIIRTIEILQTFIGKSNPKNEREKAKEILYNLMNKSKISTLKLLCASILNTNKLLEDENLKKQISDVFWIKDNEELIRRIAEEKLILKRKKTWKKIIVLSIATIIDTILIAVFGDLLANAIYDFHLREEPFVQGIWFLVILIITVLLLGIIGFVFYKRIDEWNQIK